jgi:hypothetical protein
MAAFTRVLILSLLGACAEAPAKTPAPAPTAASVAEVTVPDATTVPDASRPDGAPMADAAEKPICVRAGTRSEGWGYPDGRFIRWAKCKKVTPTCDRGKEGEGWYDRGALIVAGRCP